MDQPEQMNINVHQPQETPPPPAYTAPRTLRWAIPLGLALLTLLVFAASVRNGFVNWDDDVNIVNNSAFRGLDSEHINWMFTTVFGGHYQPLTWVSLAVDYSLFGGLNASGFHLTSVLLHALGAVLFFLVAKRLLLLAFPPAGPAIRPAFYWSAAFAAAVFALHPLRVESVTWITERRDVLSGVFMFACLLFYLKATEKNRLGTGWYILSVLLFAMSLMSKAAALSLPIVLLVIDIYPAKRCSHQGATAVRLIAEKLPFLALSVGAGIVALKAQAEAGALQSVEQLDILSRIAIASYGTVFYVFKLFFPTNLSPLYAIPPREQLLGITFVLTTAVVVLSVIMAIAFRKKRPAFLAALICYLVLLGPVSGLAQSGKQLVADRYSYLSLLPFALLLAGGLLRMHMDRDGRPNRVREIRTFSALAGVYVFAIMMLTAYQTTMWRDSFSLWACAVNVEPNSSIAQVNLAETLRNEGMPEAAFLHYRKAAELDPKDAKAHNGLGITLLDQKQYKPALLQLAAAVELAPDHPGYRCNLAYVLAGFNRLEEAAQEYEAALVAAPGWLQACRELGPMQMQLGQYDKAKETLSQGLRYHPNDDRLAGDLAWLLATCPADGIRDGDQAVSLAVALCEQTRYSDANALNTLAAAHAERGDYDEAVRWTESAIALARESENKHLVELSESRLLLYQSKKPYRDDVVVE